ncbi:ATP-dependent RNA helicase HrpA [Microbacterium sp. YY-01]|uniref:ATP-dependent RNA helicase HrpA n=1 Tax=Microbacterium sp. YY-01 TaxID=3421634 RepID=UPI003D165111
MSTPLFSYPPELPVSAAREQIGEAITNNQVVIIAGATGSGKTTQLPKICLELGRSAIAHTQPRRLAARTIAERVAEEMQVELGGLVGYRVRFTDQASADTRITLMTDGILLNEIHRDRLLHRYDTIIIDEAHERSLNVDFLLGYLRQILVERPELKVIITSATIDPESFAQHFALPPAQGLGDKSSSDSAAVPHPAPIIEVSGRTFPVEVRYRAHDSQSPQQSETSRDQRNKKDAADADSADPTAIVAALRELDREAPGDVLVFLPGEAEIRDAADAVRAAYSNHPTATEVLPLYGRLSASEQHRVFERPAPNARINGKPVSRRVVLATNVAETSLTVPGIKYVIDTGTARISRYSARSKVQRLPIEAISQASAQQRSGRAGRTSHGIAIRLYSEDDFDARPEFTEPEILRTSLASVVLQMLALGFGDITEFPFLTPPDSRGVRAALELLTELRAITPPRTPEATPTLTRIGRRMARMPIDPRFARMLLEAQHLNVTDSVVPIVAALSIHDVRERPSADAPQGVRDEAERMHARFSDPTSDFLTLLNLWNYLREQQKAQGSSAFRRMCRQEHINYVRVREWFDVHRQLKSLLSTRSGDKKLGGHTHVAAAGTTASGHAMGDAVHQALLAGLLSHIGILDERTVAKKQQGAGKPGDKKHRITEYRGARGIRFSIFPGSGLRKKSPAAVMAAEIVETSRTFARTVAQIDPAWAESLAGDLAKSHISEPRWSKDAGAAIATEKVSLFGVDIIPRRRVQFARIDRAGARDLFVRHALVEGEWDPSRIDKRVTAFWRKNHELRRRLEKREERERRRDILAGDETIYAFYDARVSRDVFDVRSFEKWWRNELTTQPHLLTMRESDLIDDEESADQRDFPTRWQQGDQTVHLAYRFEPGAADDGVSVVVPLALLAGLQPAGFDWQVPGLRPELMTGLLRALPKNIRRHVVPAADWADKFGDELRGEGPESHGGLPPSSLLEALARRIQPLANQPVRATDFDLDRVPSHLHMNFRVVDERGRVVGSGRNLGDLQQQLARRMQQSVARSVTAQTNTGQASTGKASKNGRGGKHPDAAGTTGADSLAAVAAASASTQQSGLTTWPEHDVAEMVDRRVAGGVVRGYPALVDDGSSVSVRIEATAEDAEAALRQGVLRLVLLAVPSPASYVLEHVTAHEKLALAASPYATTNELLDDARTAVASSVIDAAVPGGVVRTRADFERVRDAVSARMVDDMFACVSLAARVLTLSREVEKAMKKQNSLALLAPLADMRRQLDGLIFRGFIGQIGVEQLAHVPRYLQGMLERLQTLADAPGRDRTRMTEYERVEQAFTAAGGTVPMPTTTGAAANAAEPLHRARWLLEEYRVSLFAQKLGTAQSVSPQRIMKLLAE